MVKPIIVIADCDEDYVMALEEKILEEFGEKVELEIITEKYYFHQYFSCQRTVEVLLVGEELYFEELQKNNISNILVLHENLIGIIEKDSHIKPIIKYSSTNKIYQQIINANSCLAKLCTDKQLSKTKVIVVYSPIGGVGKTTLALGVGAYLAKEYKVLYIGAERMNTFQYHFKTATGIPNSVGMELAESDLELYIKIESMIETEILDFFRPFSVNLSALNLDYSVYNKIIKIIKEADEYDYIIVDTDIVFDKTKAVMITEADNVILVGNRNQKTKYVMNILKENMVYDNLEKYFYICNCNEKNKDDEKVLDIFESFIVSDFVKYIDNIEEIDLQQLAEEKDIQKISLLVM